MRSNSVRGSKTVWLTRRIETSRALAKVTKIHTGLMSIYDPGKHWSSEPVQNSDPPTDRKRMIIRFLREISIHR
jgi:hypothetical protein